MNDPSKRADACPQCRDRRICYPQTWAHDTNGLGFTANYQCRFCHHTWRTAWIYD